MNDVVAASPGDDKGQVVTTGYVFEISLSVLNHLGRNLYRNFITVLGEAISNSWDADASEVRIYINKDTGSFIIKDTGDGMDHDDFQHKFLKVGYSKRKGNGLSSPGKRPYIGAKGIGKLALLSCAETITVVSKTEKTEYIGGVIKNSGLNDAIKNDLTPDQYALGEVDMSVFGDHIKVHKKGTIIHFDEFREDIRSSIPYLKKLIALYFRFSLVDESFKIYVNDEEVKLSDLAELSNTTEFVWNINNLKDPYLETLTKLKSPQIDLAIDIKATGFIATVEKPRYLKIPGTEEKVGIDLFVNGRLRERDILKHSSDFATRYIASYLYGQIHYDVLDGEKGDSFTTSREGIVPGDVKYDELITALKEHAFEQISNKWDELRLERGEEGDDDNPRKTVKERRARSLYAISSSEYTETKNAEVDKWLKALLPDAEFNIPAYVDCFVTENLLRKQVEGNSLTPTACTNVDPSGQTCEVRNPGTGTIGLCAYCKGSRGVRVFQDIKKEAGIAIQIRVREDSALSYLEYLDLAKVIKDEILKDEDNQYKPLRNSVMHATLITEEAKRKLTTVYENIKARVVALLTTPPASGGA